MKPYIMLMQRIISRHSIPIIPRRPNGILVVNYQEYLDSLNLPREFQSQLPELTYPEDYYFVARGHPLVAAVDRLINEKYPSPEVALSDQVALSIQPLKIPDPEKQTLHSRNISLCLNGLLGRYMQTYEAGFTTMGKYAKAFFEKPLL